MGKGSWHAIIGSRGSLLLLSSAPSSAVLPSLESAAFDGSLSAAAAVDAAIHATVLSLYTFIIIGGDKYRAAAVSASI